MPQHPLALSEAVDPSPEFRLRNAGAKAAALQPGSAAGIFSQIFTASADAAAGGGAKGNQRDARKVIALHKGIHDPGLFAKPDGIADKGPGVAGQGQRLASELGTSVLVVLLPGGAAAVIAPVQVVGGVGWNQYS